MSPVAFAEPASEGIERRLVLRARTGDAQAMRALYERHAPRIMRFLRDMLRDRHSADDALQETFARVFQRIDSLEDPERVLPWVFGIARRVCQEQRRCNARHAPAALGSDENATEPRDPLTPEAMLVGAESAAALERAIAKLSPDRRAILLLRCDHLLSYEEIAVAMTFSVAKVKVELHRARATLREVLRLHGETS